MLLARDPDLADMPTKLSLLGEAQSVKQKDIVSQVQYLEQQYKKYQKLQKDGLFDDKSAQDVFRQKIHQLSCLIDDVSINRVKMKNSCDTLAKYWGEDSATYRPENIFATLCSFVVAFRRSVVNFQKEKAKAKRNSRQPQSEKRTGISSHRRNTIKNQVKGKTMKGSDKNISLSMASSPMLLEIQKRRSLISPPEDD